MWKQLRATASSIKQGTFPYLQGPLPNIAIFGIRRGGSTFLADGVWDEVGMFGVDEPFAAFPGHSALAERKASLLPTKPHCQLIDLTDDEIAQVRSYVEGLCSASHRFGTCRRLKFPGYANRTALKILNAPCLIDWFSSELRMDVLFLSRHPASQALSVLRQGWDFSAEAYFSNEAFCDRHLTGTQVDFARRAMGSDDRWRKAILNWVVESYIPLKSVAPGILKLTYEELTLLPGRTIDRVAERLRLTCRDRFVANATRPSSSSRLSTASTNRRIAAGSRASLVEGWRNNVSEDQLVEGQRTLDVFEITAYSMDRTLPSADIMWHADEAAASLRPSSSA